MREYVSRMNKEHGEVIRRIRKSPRGLPTSQKPKKSRTAGEINCVPDRPIYSETETCSNSLYLATRQTKNEDGEKER